MGIDELHGFQLVPFNHLNQLFFFVAVVAARIEDDAFLAIVVDEVSVFLKRIKCKPNYIGHYFSILRCPQSKKTLS
jgi:hypothetical protein